jgi:hypothetical protein
MKKTELERSMMDLTFKAKLLLESRHPEEKELEWAHAATIETSGIRSRVEIYVLCVEQPFGYIVASYAARAVKVLDENLYSLITYNVKEIKAMREVLKDKQTRLEQTPWEKATLPRGKSPDMR